MGDGWDPLEKERIRCPAVRILRFFRELAILLMAGVPLAEALESQVQYADEEEVQLVLDDLLRTVTIGGKSLSEAMESYPRVFSKVSIAMVQLGESTGRLPEACTQLASWMERDLNVRRKVKSSLAYPAFSLALTAVLTLLLFIFIVPNFVGLLTQMGTELPFPTRVLMMTTAFVTSPLGWSAALLGVGAGLSLLRLALSTLEGQLACSRFLFALPVVGPLLVCSTMSRYCAAAQAMCESGTDIMVVVKLAAVTSGNPLVQHDLKSLTQSLSEGESLSSHLLSRSDIYVGPIGLFCSIGEESGRTAESFSHSRRFYEDEVDCRLRAVTALMEPLVMSFLALVIGFVIISLMLPMHNFLNALG